MSLQLIESNECQLLAFIVHMVQDWTIRLYKERKQSIRFTNSIYKFMGHHSLRNRSIEIFSEYYTIRLKMSLQLIESNECQLLAVIVHVIQDLTINICKGSNKLSLTSQDGQRSESVVRFIIAHRLSSF